MNTLKFSLVGIAQSHLKDLAVAFLKVIHAAYLLNWLFELIFEKMLIHQF